MAQQNQEPYYRVINGPSKFDFLTLLDTTDQRSVTFRIDTRTHANVEAKLQSVARDGVTVEGPGESWIIEAELVGTLGFARVLVRYNTHRRTGELRFQSRAASIDGIPQWNTLSQDQYVQNYLR
jgi:hypothetical protein